MAAFVQGVVYVATRDAGHTQTVATSGSATVTVGNTIFVMGISYGSAAFGTETMVDNLGNTYTLVERVKKSADDEAASLWVAPITTGGTLSTLTWSHRSVTDSYILTMEVSGVGDASGTAETASGTATSATFVSNRTIPAGGLVVGVTMHSSGTTAPAAGSASGSPSTSITRADYWQGSGPNSGLFYALAPAEVTGFTGTSTFASSDYAAVGQVWAAPSGATVPTWTTPADTVSMSTTPELKFDSPTAAVAQHFYLELDTANTFDTGNLRTYRSDLSQTNWAYWDGGAWQAMPSTGLPSGMSGNEVRYTVTDALSSTTWYRRVRAGT